MACNLNHVRAYLAGKLEDDDQRLELLEHLDDCRRCWDLVFQARRLANVKAYKKRGRKKFIEATEHNLRILNPPAAVAPPAQRQEEDMTEAQERYVKRALKIGPLAKNRKDLVERIAKDLGDVKPASVQAKLYAAVRNGLDNPEFLALWESLKGQPGGTPPAGEEHDESREAPSPAAVSPQPKDLAGEDDAPAIDVFSLRVQALEQQVEHLEGELKEREARILELENVEHQTLAIESARQEDPIFVLPETKEVLIRLRTAFTELQEVNRKLILRHQTLAEEHNALHDEKMRLEKVLQDLGYQEERGFVSWARRALSRGGRPAAA